MDTYDALQTEINNLEQQQKLIHDKLDVLKCSLKPIALWIDDIENYKDHDTIHGFSFDRAKLLISTLYEGKKLQLQHPRWGNYNVYIIDEGNIRIQEENIKQPYIDTWHMLGIMLKGEGDWYILPQK